MEPATNYNKNEGLLSTVQPQPRPLDTPRIVGYFDNLNDPIQVRLYGECQMYHLPKLPSFDVVGKQHTGTKFPSKEVKKKTNRLRIPYYVIHLQRGLANLN